MLISLTKELGSERFRRFSKTSEYTREKNGRDEGFKYLQTYIYQT